ncbi:hypothetical protein [Rhizobium rhizophilum]|uniref:Uncharacterized protein n=1 Tax=Rhizobium rhizophilum TaxID=1850373 RepID=A0ABY2QZI0_9HYPH|nr:hypothetical protein [Rhizobium rhizophilum]THV16927.1 hypothetical protein E9677_02730 [Rhizobium rhizophilum]
MHETYAALAIIALQKKVGKPDQLSEDEFYAQFCEAPWHRLSRRCKAFFARLKLSEDGARCTSGQASPATRTAEA